jgi:hypothetical protein
MDASAVEAFRMKRALVLVVAVLALWACKPSGTATPQANNPQDLQIEIGRYGVMVNQAAALTAQKPGTSMAEPSDPKEMARSLRETVWRFNVERSELCGRNLYAEVSCTPALEPVWMSEPADASPSLSELSERSQLVGQEVQKFWSAVCDDARRAVADPQQRRQVCAIE